MPGFPVGRIHTLICLPFGYAYVPTFHSKPSSLPTVNRPFFVAIPTYL